MKIAVAVYLKQRLATARSALGTGAEYQFCSWVKRKLVGCQLRGKWIQAAVGIRLVAETGFAPSQPGVVVMGLA